MNDFVFKVLDFVATNDMQSEIMWECYQDKTVKFYVNCNDFFFWACADCVDLTENNFQELVQAVTDVHNILDYSSFGSLLFCARQRKMRPQGAYYEYIDEQLWPLFDACGPEREVGFGNPKAITTIKAKIRPKINWELNSNFEKLQKGLVDFYNYMFKGVKNGD